MKPRPAVSTATAAAILQHHLGTRPERVKRIHGGLANHVFESRVGRQNLIVRISDEPEKLQFFMKEQWAVTKAQEKGVPTPEILEVGNHLNGLPYMILVKVSGRPGNICENRMDVLQQLGKLAALINSIRTSDFGHIFDWSLDKLSRNHTWQEYLDNELKVDQRLETFEKSGVLEHDHLRNLRRGLKTLRNWRAKPSLNHGDLRLKNVVLKNDRIAAILDWENCTSNIAPCWDLSIALHDLTLDEKEVFLEGYGLDVREYIQLAPTLKTLNVLNYGHVVQLAAKRKNKRQLLGLKARLNGAFDLYSL